MDLSVDFPTDPANFLGGSHDTRICGRDIKDGPMPTWDFNYPAGDENRSFFRAWYTNGKHDSNSPLKGKVYCFL